MARGGKRRGAGRKHTVGLEHASKIREDCEQRARALQRKQAHERITRKLAKRGIHFDEQRGGEFGEADELIRNPILNVPTQYRPLVVEYGRKSRGKPAKLPNPPATWSRELQEVVLEYVHDAIDRMRKHRRLSHIPEGCPMGVLLTEPFPRLSKGRGEIIKAVAEAWEVSERTVRTIWESADYDV